jgi:hypothetical protein
VVVINCFKEQSPSIIVRGIHHPSALRIVPRELVVKIDTCNNGAAYTLILI